MIHRSLFGLGLLYAAWGVLESSAAIPPEWGTTGSKTLDAYFRDEVAKLESVDWMGPQEEWPATQERLRDELRDMLGLKPWPARSDLLASVTGRETGDGFTMEKIHYQSLPGLYATANLYLPKAPAGTRHPAVLYVCGHGRIKKEGFSYGNKAHYQHHGSWLAQNGYVCLVLDTIQLGELEGLHHGTYRENLWWWNSRGYTPAGVEAWNGIRGLDYLQSRPEVDPTKLGVTGRSGGGAYSWWVAALDTRVQAAIPVAGITDLRNHVIDGCVEGHCDCMFFVNRYRWDYDRIAALVAPRALLLSNTDKDRIFPLDGVVRVHSATAKVYERMGASDRLGLLITEGPHADTQQLQLPALKWLDRFLKGIDRPITSAASKPFQPEQVRVFSSFPADEKTTRIHETFVPPAPPSRVPADAREWEARGRQREADLRDQVFQGWPQGLPQPVARLVATRIQGATKLQHFQVSPQPHVTLEILVQGLAGEQAPSGMVHVEVMDRDPLTGGWESWTPPTQPSDAPAWRVWFSPRGGQASHHPASQAKQNQIRRRYMLVGQTQDGMGVWDVRQVLEALNTLWPQAKIRLSGQGNAAILALLAAGDSRFVTQLNLIDLPKSLADGPDFLNILRVTDLRESVAFAATVPDRQVRASGEALTLARQVGQVLGWDPKKLQVVVNQE